MAIVPLEKVTLYGHAKQQDAVLNELQSLGCMHLEPLSTHQPSAMAGGVGTNEIHDALKYLRTCPLQRQPAKSRRGYNLFDVAEQASAIKFRVQVLDDRQEALQREIDKLRPWGDFRLPTSEELGDLKLWFFVLRHREAKDLPASELVYEVVATDIEYAYVVVVAAQQPDDMIGTPVELDQRPLSELQQQLVSVEDELEEHYWERVALTRWCHFLAEDLAEADDEESRQAAARLTTVQDKVFAVQGWVPEQALADVEQLAARHRLAFTREVARAADTPPTLLKNPERIAGAEGVVTFYITPSYGAWDPTLVVYLSFSIFFGMIMADAGYGMLLAVGLAAIWGRLGKTLSSRRFRDLLTAIVTCTIAYGILIGSYFGVSPPAGSLPDKLVLRLDGQPVMENQNVMMAISVCIGGVHLMLANLITAWRFRGHAHALGALGWATGIFGGLLLGGSQLTSNPLVRWLASLADSPPEAFSAWLASLGTAGTIVGVSMVFCFSSQRPLFSGQISHWLWRTLDGAQALTNVTKAFGDVLSYLRLFALGLASAQLAATFNGLASGAAEIRGPGILLALMILAVGHGVNLLLGIMGGVVHGLRLNCIEFFNWSLTEEGHPFQAFCKKAKH